MNVGLLGLEHFHVWNYVRAIKSLPGCKITCAYDSDPGLLQRVYAETGARVYKDLDRLLEDEEPGFAIVCSANASHADITVAAAKAGWHILCEKPMATTLQDCHRMKEACANAGVTFGLALPMRHSAPIKRARDLLVSGLVGRPLLVKTTNRGKVPPGWFVDKARSGGGAIMDHTIHNLDLMRWLLRSEVTRVFAAGGRLLHGLEVEDVGLIQVTFKNGAVGTIDTSWSLPESFPTWGDVTLEITGEKGQILVDAFRQSFTVYGSSGSMPVKSSYWGADPDAAMLADFVEAVTERRTPAADAEDGIVALEVTLAAYKSLATGEPVDLA